MENVHAVRANTLAAGSILLTAVICALVLAFIPNLGMKINSALQPIHSALGK